MLYIKVLYITILFFAALSGLFNFKKLDLGGKIFAAYVFVTFLSEMTATYLSIKWINNMPIYAIYSLIEFGMLSLYFNYSVDSFTQKKIGYIIGLSGIILGILNIIFFQPLNSYNSYFLFIEGIGIITMALFSFFRMMMTETELILYKHPHFWISAILAVFWSVTFLNWGLGGYLYNNYPEASKIVSRLILCLNIALYCLIGFLFLRYPKMKTKYAK